MIQQWAHQHIFASQHKFNDRFAIFTNSHKFKEQTHTETKNTHSHIDLLS